MRENTYSKKQSSEQISRKLAEFIKEIQYKNRNPVDNTMLICSVVYEVVVRIAPWMVGKKR